MKLLGRMRKLLHTAIFLTVSTLLLPYTVPIAIAQTTTGSLRGVVTDSSGGVIPDARVTARNVATGVETRVTTNSEGIYNIANLPPGTYLLSVEKESFKRQEFQEVSITIGQTTSIDAVLQAGQITETVTVTAAGEELVQKENVQVSSTLQSRQVSELPSNLAGNGIDTLALLAPGVVPGNAGVTNTNGTDISVNGNRTRSNNFTIDGGDNNDLSIAGPAFFVNNQDLVGEFQVITNNFSAEYGRNQGAIVNIVTKSGTNDLHGSAFWFHRDRKFLDSLDNIEKRGGQKDPDPLLYNVFGGTIGGPIVKDKLFYFGSLQFITDRRQSTIRSNSPAIAAEELSRLKNAFPTSPAIDALANFSAFALPFGSVSERTDKPQDATVTIGGQNFRVAYPQRSFARRNTEKEFSVRADYKINEGNAVWYRHLYQKDTNENLIPLFFVDGSNGFFGNVPSDTNYGTATWTSQISNTAVNEFRFTFNKLSVSFGGGCAAGTAGCVPAAADILSEFPQINFTGLRASSGDSLQQVGPDSGFPQGRTVHNYQFADNFSKSFGRHQIKTGVDIRRITNDVPFLPDVAGRFNFSNSTRAINNTPATFTLAVGEPTVNYTEWDQFYYVQDDWRIKDNLTLNLGLRYEYTTQPINQLHKLTLDRESNPNTALWRQDLPVESRIVPKISSDKNNWAPRLGFAWRPRLGDSRLGRMLFGEQDSTVISGGYSIAYDPQFYNILLNISNSSPFVFLNSLVNPSIGLPPGSGPTAQTVQDFARQNNLVRTNTFDPRFFSQTVVDQSFRSPYSEQWSLRIQREINRNNVVEVRYVGTHGVGLFQQNNVNPNISRLYNGFTRTINGQEFTFPAFSNLVPQGITPLTCTDNPATPGNEGACNGRILPRGLVTSRFNGGQSLYHGLQTRYQGRLSNQLLYGVAYTWSKALDNASEIFFTNFGRQTPQSWFNTTDAERSYSGFDRRHALALNWVWDLPAFKDQKGILGRVLGGWQVNGTYFLQSGTRYTPTQVFNAFLFDDNGLPTTYADQTDRDTLRPFYGNPNAPRDLVGINQVDAALLFGVEIQNPNGFYSLNELNTSGNTVSISKDQVRYIFNGPGAARVFGTPFGDVPRNIERGPRLNQLNLGLFKNIRITERVRLQARLEAFNALNHPQPGVGDFLQGNVVPDVVVEDAGTTFNRRDEMELARRAVQIGFRIIF